MLEVITTDEFKNWYEDLSADHQEAVFRVVELLESRGTNLCFPYSSALKGTSPPLRELRVKAQGDQLRIAYAFDPTRNAVLLLGGDKTGDDRFYEWLIPTAEKLWAQYLRELAERGNP